MQFVPKTDDGVAFLFDAGTYNFEVRSAEERVSKNGNPMIQVDLRVYVGETPFRLRDFLMEKMAFKLKHFCQAVGLSAAYEAGDLDANTLIGLKGRAVVIVEEKEGFPARNAVKDYEVPEAGFEPAAKSDEPPF